MKVAERNRDVAVSPLRFVAMSAASTVSPTIPPRNIVLDQYRVNPVVLWQHDVERLPIGRGAAQVDGDQLLVDVWFDQGDPFARRIERKYRDGFLYAVSVGLRRHPELCLGHDGAEIDYSRQRFILTEISACSVPEDTFAVIVRPDGNGHGGGL